MVSVAVSKLGCTELFFVETGVKVDGAYYRDGSALSTYAACYRPTYARRTAGDMFVFQRQQDSAPAHRARPTVEYLRQATPDFISPNLWPPNSPNLNPVDYKILGLSSKPWLSEAHTQRQRAETVPGSCMIRLWADSH